MTTLQAARRMVTVTLGTVGVALALAANAATFTERSNDRIDADRDRQATVPPQAVPQRDAGNAESDRVESTTESGISQDQLIAQRVQAALDDDPELKDVYLRVEANSGQVRVHGMVATTSQRDRAIETASAVQGVAGVDDAITLRQPSASR